MHREVNIPLRNTVSIIILPTLFLSLSKTGSRIVTFSGTDFVRVGLHPMMVTHTNDISIRFKTRKPDGLLFSTSNEQDNGFLRAELEGGRVRVVTNVGGEERVNTIYFCCQTRPQSTVCNWFKSPIVII